ncbi:DUF5518 domain-containing protein [Haladaptatus caseinilyticus]|uniref:DUF5518 domain-containing protein n=1 Tax=Haladaptatus caseinilyticus TaxID=2993314 RepID=UPI00224AF5F6|nr:DUF5518 domain-containing protein [Haladaptatus caseinilyticus]
MGNNDTLVHALIGAAVTLVTSFVPFSPVLGGAVAAYLSDADTGDGVKIGAISGAIATIPMILIGFLFASIFLFGSAPGGFTVFLLVIGMIAILYTAGLSALGGYIGAYMTNSNRGIDVTSQ